MSYQVARFSYFFLLAIALVAVKTHADDLSKPYTFVLIAVKSVERLDSISMKAGFRHVLDKSQLNQKESYFLLPAKGGKLVIREVVTSDLRHYKLDRNEWSFALRQGAVNYVGSLGVQYGNSGFRSGVQLTNNASFAMEHMEKQFASVLQTHPMHYAGPGTDSFFSLIRGVK